MIPITVHHAGVYRFAQETHWQNPLPFVGLHVSGLIYHRRGDAQASTPLEPHLNISGAGNDFRYAYGENRENWVVQIETADIRNTQDPQTCEIYDGQQWLRIPAIIPLSPTALERWQRHFMSMHVDFRDQSARSQLRLRLRIAEVLNAFLDSPVETSRPVDKFKQLIDSDETCQANLSTLSRQCGYSADHMRVMFQAAFGITPVRYRTRRRLALATDLLSNTDLPVATIAERLGFLHTSHFCKAYKAQYGVSPGKDVHRIRL